MGLIPSVRANLSAIANEKDYLPDEEVMGQMNTLISAAHDTTASAIARMLHSLAQDLPRQRRLREELNKARADSFDELDYHTVTTLRKSRCLTSSLNVTEVGLV